MDEAFFMPLQRLLIQEPVLGDVGLCATMTKVVLERLPVDENQEMQRPGSMRRASGPASELMAPSQPSRIERRTFG
ncbi:hypothetical protein ASG60_06760 [Methylobacterium sp. Leaf469]|nr:hypothetical protein ASG60_06760 [Methylobacterium sp. Leaf469]